MASKTRAAAVATLAVAAMAAVAMHRPQGLAGDPADPTGAIVAAAAWVVWALLGYLSLAVALAATGHLVGSAPSAARVRDSAASPWSPRIPRVVRRCVDAAVGATAAAVVVTAAAPGAAYADARPVPRPATAAPSAASTTLDWPALQPRTHTSAHPAPTTPAPSALVSAPARRHTHAGEEIVVRAGDSLWSLTARRLGPGAPSALVAAAWPRLYAANRAVIGPNPSVILPGQRLVPPAHDTRRPR